MSIAKDLEHKTKRVDALEKQIAEMAEAGVQMSAKCDELAKQIEAMSATHAAELADIRTKAAEAVAAMQAVHAEEMTAQKTAMDAVAADLVGARDELGKARAALANPAFADAAARGVSVDKAQFPGESSDVEPVGILERFDAIKEPAERTRFFNENEAAIKAAMAEQAKKETK